VKLSPVTGNAEIARSISRSTVRRLLGGDVGVDADRDGFAINLHGGSLVAMGAGHDEGFAGRARGGLLQRQRYHKVSVNDLSFHNDFLESKCADRQTL